MKKQTAHSAHIMAKLEDAAGRPIQYVTVPMPKGGPTERPLTALQLYHYHKRRQPPTLEDRLLRRDFGGWY